MMISGSQKEIVGFLSKAANFDGEPVQRIDTHLSHVFLVGERVYKIKRAVKYDFADFSTLEKRKRACDKEVEINRRTAPEMYLGVTPIYRGRQGVSWSANGEIAEWAVKMARFDRDKQFDEMLKRGELGVSHIEKLADNIAAFHLNAEEKRSVRSSAHISGVIDELATALLENGGDIIRVADIEHWAMLSHQALNAHRKLLDARARHGWVRHCHGDLHLANICMFNGEPTPFDAIEFGDEFANIDVLYDLAFTLTDLARYERNDLAGALLDRYLSVTRDYAGLSLLPLFQSLRAAVRAMVLSFPAQAQKVRSTAKRYFTLALKQLTVDTKPRLIAIGGYSGTGKSTLARRLANELDECPVILRSDIIRKRLAGVSPETRLESDAYSEEKTEQVYRRLCRDAARVLRAGRSAIVDATFLSTFSRGKAEAVAQKTHAPFAGVWLTAPRDVLIDRIAARRNDASDATAAVVLKQLQEKPELKGWLVVDAGGGLQKTLANTLRALSGGGQSPRPIKP